MLRKIYDSKRDTNCESKKNIEFTQVLEFLENRNNF